MYIQAYAYIVHIQVKNILGLFAVCLFLFPSIEWNADNLVSNEIFTLPKVMNAIYRKSYWKFTLAELVCLYATYGDICICV